MKIKLIDREGNTVAVGTAREATLTSFILHAEKAYQYMSDTHVKIELDDDTTYTFQEVNAKLIPLKQEKVK